VTAVFVDQTKKAGQIANVVIGGLSIPHFSYDKNLITNMLATELNLHVDIVKYDLEDQFLEKIKHVLVDDEVMRLESRSRLASHAASYFQ